MYTLLVILIIMLLIISDTLGLCPPDMFGSGSYLNIYANVSRLNFI